jgi:CheY-like chemotaxis protein
VNAVDAMPDGGSLRFKTRRLPGNRTLLSVEDTGTGMPAHVLEHATDPFFTTKPQGKGTGLGLSLAYSTVKAHHGDLHIKSAPGQGTAVELHFPCAASTAGTSTTQDLRDSPSASQSLRILLVDDDELIQSAVSMQLEALGHQPTVAACGEAALDLLGKGLCPDIVILDMNMPGWGGARTLPKLREALPGVPIFLSTGRLDQQAIDLSRAHPGVSILPKPFGFQELGAAFAGVRPTL